MKKILLLTMLFVCSLGFSQGNTAKDFTAKDINGKTHRLHSYLEKGKSVIMDISATWCAPCWDLHETQLLKDTYYAYGPDGSDELMVFYVEGDEFTDIEDLKGVVKGDTPTKGDWVTGTPYPILDDHTIIDKGYPTQGFPTLYTVCANNKTAHIITAGEREFLKAPEFVKQVSQKCETDALKGVANHAGIDRYRTHIDGNVENRLCGYGQAIVVTTAIRNYGNNAITTAKVELVEGDRVVSTKEFSGNIEPFKTSEQIVFDPVEVKEGVKYKSRVAEINGKAPHYAGIQVPIKTDHITKTAKSNEFLLKVFTDFQPQHMSWTLTNSSDKVVAKGGPYKDKDVTVEERFTLPSDDECYALNLKHTQEDPWEGQYWGKGFHLISKGEILYKAEEGEIAGQKVVIPAIFKIDKTVTSNREVSDLGVYPNPTAGIVDITLNEAFDLEIYDATRKLVFSRTNNVPSSTFDLSFLNSGVYILSIKSRNKTTARKLVIQSAR